MESKSRNKRRTCNCLCHVDCVEYMDCECCKIANKKFITIEREVDEYRRIAAIQVNRRKGMITKTKPSNLEQLTGREWINFFAKDGIITQNCGYILMTGRPN